MTLVRGGKIGCMHLCFCNCSYLWWCTLRNIYLYETYTLFSHLQLCLGANTSKFRLFPPWGFFFETFSALLLWRTQLGKVEMSWSFPFPQTLIHSQILHSPLSSVLPCPTTPIRYPEMKTHSNKRNILLQILPKLRTCRRRKRFGNPLILSSQRFDLANPEHGFAEHCCRGSFRSLIDLPYLYFPRRLE